MVARGPETRCGYRQPGVCDSGGVLFPLLTPGFVADRPDVPAFVTVGDESFSQADIVGAATSASERLGGLSRVAVEAVPSMQTVVAVVAALLAGVTVVPVAPDSGDAERRHVLDDSGAQAWLGATPTDPCDRPHLPVRLYARSWHRHPQPPADTVAMIMYTSGTTGAPKGVVSTHGSLAAGIDALADAWAWTADDTLVHGLPLFHVHGLILGLLGPLRVGSRLHHTVRPRPEAYAAAAQGEHPGTMYFGVPTVWSRIVAEPEHARSLSGARLLISGSAPLPPTVFDAVAELTEHEPVERYGMTETLITLSARADGPRRAGWVGSPVAGVRTRLRDESGDELPHDGDAVGELLVQGPMLGAGYLNRPEATAASWLPDGWFATGDAALIEPGGMHRIVGRLSTDLIKSGGYRVGAGEVEASLLEHPTVAEVAVVGPADDDLGQRIVAYVVVRPDAATDAAAAEGLIEHVATALSVHKRPREVHFVDELPRNAMGKVVKKALLETSD